MKATLFFIIVAALASFAEAAQPRNFEFFLDAAQVSPPTNSNGAARGTVVIDQDEGAITVSLGVAALSSAQTSAAIVNANQIVRKLPVGAFSQRFSVTAGELAALRAGEWRVTVSTVLFPAGEIGGFVRPFAQSESVAFPSSNGSLDATFGNGGIVFTEMRGSNNVAQAVAVQPDGRFVVAGFDRGVNEDFAVARYNPDGSLDPTFDNDGYVTTATAPGEEVGYAVAFDSSGRIVVAGQIYDGAMSDFGVVRYNPNGSLDTTFNGQGFVRTSIGTVDAARSIAIQADGKIVVAGQTFNGLNNDIAILRYNDDGSLDETFDGASGNGNGVIVIAVGPGNDFAYSVAIQSDARIVVAGYYFSGTNNDALILRLNANGTPDTTFDGDGIVTASAGTNTDEAFAVAIQPDGKIVFAGCTNSSAPNDFFIGRLNPDGSRDASFGGDGLTVTPIGAGAEFANAVAIQQDGKIVAAGFSSNGANNDFAIVRKNADGTPDTSFDGDGELTTALATSTDSANGVAIQADGKIIAVGRTVRTTADFGIVRYGYGTNAATNDGFIDANQVVDIRFENAFRSGTVAAGAINSYGIPPLTAGLYHLTQPRAISTTAEFDGFVDLKLTLSTRIAEPEFAAAQVLNLENGVWIDRTATFSMRDFSSRTIFARLSKLAIVAVVSAVPPQAEFADLTGRVFRTGQKPAAAIINIAGPNNVANARTNPFGYFRFRNVALRRSYLMQIRSKGVPFRSILMNFDDDEPTNLNLSEN